MRRQVGLAAGGSRPGRAKMPQLRGRAQKLRQKNPQLRLDAFARRSRKGSTGADRVQDGAAGSQQTGLARKAGSTNGKAVPLRDSVDRAGNVGRGRPRNHGSRRRRARIARCDGGAGRARVANHRLRPGRQDRTPAQTFETTATGCAGQQGRYRRNKHELLHS